MQAVEAAFDGGIALGVGAFKVGVRHDPRAAVAGTDDIDHVQVMILDQPVEVDIDHVQAWGGAPMAEEARLDVPDGERLAQQGVRFEVDLADGKIVRGAPVGVHAPEQVR